MGCDIHGYVEVNKYERSISWYGVVDIGNITTRDYDIFGCLFGVRYAARFEPIAANRGLPNRVSWDVRNIDPEEHPDYHSLSYITAKEIQAINWQAEQPANLAAQAIAMTKDWQVLFKLIDVLVAEYGIDNVRMVVWFDN